MGDYKPLNNADLAGQEYALNAPRGLHHNEMYNLLLEQARRANALAKAVDLFIDDFVDRTGQATEMHEALAVYLGDGDG